MKHFGSSFTTVLLMLVVIVINAQSQATLPESPSDTEKAFEIPVWYYGLEAGAQATMSGGSFEAPCKCTYQDGSMLISPVATVFLERVLSPELHVAFGVRYAMYNQNYTAPGTLIRYAPTGEEVLIDIERTAKVRSSYLTLFVEAKWYTGLSHFYFSGGPDIGMFLKGTLSDQEQITTPGWIYPVINKNLWVYADKDIKEVYETTAVRLGIRLAAGYDVPLSATWVLAPEFGYVLGLSSVTKDNASWKLSAAQGVLRLKIGF